MAKTKVSLNGDDLGELDFEHLTIKQLYQIKAASGLTGKQFADGLEQLDPLALQTLVWFVGGNRQSLDSIDFDLSQLKVEQIDDPKDAETTPSNEDA